ncbi:MAG: hypothetical protein FWH02_08405 [Oscillospiraceae bacterium]|nr:hypothetical protein [Oscillospiraceae bacterium]
MDIILWIIVCMLAVMGVAAVLGDYLFVRRSGGLIRGNYRVITLYDDPVEVERMINKCLLRMTWHGVDSAVVLVDMGMGEQAREICTQLKSELYGSFFCAADELPDTLRRLDRLIENGK